jgi:hypothetical protein
LRAAKCIACFRTKLQFFTFKNFPEELETECWTSGSSY